MDKEQKFNCTLNQNDNISANLNCHEKIQSSVLLNDCNFNANVDCIPQNEASFIQRGLRGQTGPIGPRGKSGVVISETEPTDNEVNVWIDSDGERTPIGNDLDLQGRSLSLIDDDGQVMGSVELPNYQTDTQVNNAISTHNTSNTAHNDLRVSINTINGKIPNQATSTNQLADKDFVNSTVTSLAAFYVTSDVSGNPFATKNDLLTGTYYNQGQLYTPTRNDYALVVADETHSNKSARYLFDGTNWVYQYTLNDTPFTAAQIAALNSGITDGLVALIETAVQPNDISDMATQTWVTDKGYQTSAQVESAITSKGYTTMSAVEAKGYLTLQTLPIWDGSVE